MNSERAIPYQSISLPRPLPVRHKVREKDRDPYDGLRPLVRHYPRRRCGAGCGGHSPIAGALRPARTERLARGLFPDLWLEHGGIVYRQYAVSLPQRQRKGTDRSAQIRPRLHLFPDRRHLHSRVPGGSAGVWSLGLGALRRNLGSGSGRAGTDPFLDHISPAGLPPASISLWVGWLWRRFCP